MAQCTNATLMLLAFLPVSIMLAIALVVNLQLINAHLLTALWFQDVNYGSDACQVPELRFGLMACQDSSTGSCLLTDVLYLEYDCDLENISM